MSYAVKEIFYTLQGEGARSGRAAVFCRFAGCSLWTGREEDREQAIFQFGDTDFVGVDGEGGGHFASAAALAAAIAVAWRPGRIFVRGETTVGSALRTIGGERPGGGEPNRGGETMVRGADP